MTRRAGAGRQLPERVAGDDAVEIGVAQRPERLGAGPHQQLGADSRALHDRDQGNRLLGPQGLAERLVQLAHLPVERLDEHVDGAAAREADGEGVVVGDAVRHEAGRAVTPEHFQRLAVGELWELLESRERTICETL